MTRDIVRRTTWSAVSNTEHHMVQQERNTATRGTRARKVGHHDRKDIKHGVVGLEGHGRVSNTGLFKIYKRLLSTQCDEAHHVVCRKNHGL